MILVEAVSLRLLLIIEHEALSIESIIMINMQKIIGFTDLEIAEAIKKRQLLSIEIEFSSRCNLKCSYCYAEKSLFRDDELDLEEMYDVISQAKALGARKIIYLGAGEPFLDKKLEPIIHYVHKLGLDHIIFTNGTVINPQEARFLYEHKVVVVVKHSSNDEATFDRLSGGKGAFKSMKRGMKFLTEAGYPDESHHLGIESIISVDNIHEIPTMWRWARHNNIIPYIECVTRKGGGASQNKLAPDKEPTRILFQELSRIDREEFSFVWDPFPPIAGFACKRHLYSCIVNSQGFVQPCVGVDIQVGNIRQEKLGTILQNSPVLKDLSQIYNTIKGPCKTCEHNGECYGCRGNAYSLTGDYLASDSTCWRIKDEVASSCSFCKK